MAAGVLQDAAGNGYGGLTGSEYYFNVADTAPIAPVQNPASGSEANKNSAIALTFGEEIQVCVCAGMCSALWLWRGVNDEWWSGRLAQATLC